MRTIRTLVAILLVLGVFEGVALWLEPRLPEPINWHNPFAQYKYDQLEDLAAAGGAEVLFVGSSVVNANVDAGRVGRELGTTAYNVGLPSSNMPLWDDYLETIALERTCPQVVVIGVSIRDSNDNLPGYDNYVPRFRSSVGFRAVTGNLSLIEQLDDAAGEVSAFVRLRPRLREPGNVFSWLRSGRAPGWADANLDDFGRYLGFVDDPFRPEAQIADLRDRVFATYETGGRQFDGLTRVVHGAQANGAQVLLMQMPAMEELIIGALPNGRADTDAFDAAVTGAGEQLDVPVFKAEDMNDAEQWYADLYHMNEEGAQELTGRIIAWLQTQTLDTSGSADCEA